VEKSYFHRFLLSGWDDVLCLYHSFGGALGRFDPVSQGISAQTAQFKSANFTFTEYVKELIENPPANER
jgi:hypothetical protein